MSDIWFTSDNHYGHDNIRKYSGRPFETVHEMNVALIEKHNAVVKSNDTVYFLGDFAFQDKDTIVKTLYRLNGKKHLILGNHDKVIAKEPFLFTSAGNATGKFQSIQSYKAIKEYGQDIILFHYPMRTWDKAHWGSWALFGHVHNSLAPYRKSVDVGVDSTWVTGSATYTPFSFEQIKSFMDKQEQETVG